MKLRTTELEVIVRSKGREPLCRKNVSGDDLDPYYRILGMPQDTNLPTNNKGLNYIIIPAELYYIGNPEIVRNEKCRNKVYCAALSVNLRRSDRSQNEINALISS